MSSSPSRKVVQQFTDQTHQYLHLSRLEKLVNLLDRFGADARDLPLLRSKDERSPIDLSGQDGEKPTARQTANKKRLQISTCLYWPFGFTAQGFTAQKTSCS